MRVEVTSEEVTRLYAQGGAETDESTALYFVSTDCMREDRMEGEFVRRQKNCPRSGWSKQAKQ